MVELALKQREEREELVRELKDAEWDAQYARTVSDIQLAHLRILGVKEQIREFDEKVTTEG